MLSSAANGYVIADGIRLVPTGAGNSPGGLFYVHNDHLGTPQVITDDNQTVVWKADYDPFGKATVTTETITNNVRFPGQYFDGETGLHYNYYRYYDPRTGRYITSDSIGLGGGLNTYGYVGGNPLSFIDPLGLDSKLSFPLWGPPTTFPDDLGKCREKARKGILKKCLKIFSVVEKIACISAWRNWEQACIGDLACLDKSVASKS